MKKKTQKFNLVEDQVAYILGNNGMTEKTGMEWRDAITHISNQRNCGWEAAKSSFYRATDKGILQKVSDDTAMYAFTPAGFKRYQALRSHETALEGASRTFEDFLKERYWQQFINCINRHVPLLKIKYDDIISGLGTEFAYKLIKHPEENIQKINKLIKQLDLPIYESDGDESEEPTPDTFRPQIAIVELSPSPLKVPDAKDRHHLNQLIEVEGRVMSQTDIRAVPLVIAYKCQRCKLIQFVPQLRGKKIEPYECENPVCRRKGPFEEDDENSEIINSQDIFIESVDGDVNIMVIVDEPLCYPYPQELDSKVVKIVGILKLMKYEDKGRPVNSFVLMAHSIEPADDSSVPPPSPEEIAKFEEWVKTPEELRRKLIYNIAPHLCGLDDEKDAISLAMYSDWTWKQDPDKSIIRSSLNILIVGDPGCGKSELLSDAIKHAPKGIEGQGENSTGRGLSNSAEQHNNGVWVIRGGLYARADGGMIALDELDKIKKDDLRNLHSILSKQKQIVAKAGKVVSFNTRCASLCAGNPLHSHIDRYEPIVKQLGFDSSLFQRFDLVFVILDDPDEETDREIYKKISETVDNSAIGDSSLEREIPLDLYKKYILYARSKPLPKFSQEAEEVIGNFYLGVRKLARGRKEGNLQTVYPAVSKRTALALKKLAYCIARRIMASEVTAQHAEEAISLYRRSIISVGMGDEDLNALEIGGTQSQFIREDIADALKRNLKTGLTPDQIANETGHPLNEVKHLLQNMKSRGEITLKHGYYFWTGGSAAESLRDWIQVLKNILRRLQEKNKGPVPLADIIQTSSEAGFDNEDVEDMLEKLKSVGEIMECSMQRYRVP